MKLSELTAAALRMNRTDPEIYMLRDWGELAPVKIIDESELADGDPVVELLAEMEGSIILTADPEE
jgi:hypothetical protein